MKFANKIVSISEQTQNELRQYGFCSEVIFDPVSPSFIYIPKSINRENPVILHIGTRPNKNLKKTILALKGTPCHLRIVGNLSAGNKILLHDNGIKYSSCTNISDDELVEEYRKCDVANFPSLYEGFGMPIIEGQATGRVVVTSNRSPMKEVAGGSAVLVNPDDITSIRRGYREAINNGESYIEKGLINVKRFSIETIAKQYLNLIKSIL